jgi:DNA-directed RNA polymerase specialized sigma24 family protein
MSTEDRLSGGRSVDLLRRWQESGDLEALDELLRIEIGMLKARIRSRGANLTSPEMSVSDVAQDAVMRMLRVEPPPSFDSPEAMRAYLWLAAWRLLVGRLRQPGHEMARIDGAGSAGIDGALETTGGFSGIEARDRAVALELALSLLDPAEREILDLVYFREAGIEGAVRQFGISHDAARKRTLRARRSLAKKLATWTEIIG